MTAPAYERLGVFYLGRELDPVTQQTGADLLYDSRDLTTHAICIGMTGSGKTGLCLSLLEEAAIDGVPAIAIDPKGDIGNLLLTFPELSPEDFRPWVDEGEAARKGQAVEAFAAATAASWRKGLADWGQDGTRIARLREKAEITIYTPGSEAGRPLSVLRSFAAPDAALLDDATALKERIGSSVAGLLALLGIDADPIQSREHILLSAILDASWRKGQSPDLAAIIQAVQKPPFDKVGVFDVETFYPAKDRTALALRINGLLAAPGFETWLQGEALDVQKLLYTDTGKPRISVISIAHLNDAERMFVVTLVASEVVAWMRRQPGTTSLRALLYMDEVFGFFPPSAMPPSKLPLLTLMKQARAFGVGVVLATQNPVDLDYKGLGNAGTWFIGRLQTERDQARVIEGLLGSEAGGGLDRAGYESLMSNLAQRTFLMRNVHDDAPVLFRTRWALSYLRGPLTLTEIRRLRESGPDATREGDLGTAAGHPATAGDTEASAARAVATAGDSRGARPVVQHGVTERFMAVPEAARPPRYHARIGASVRAHYVDSKAGLDVWKSSYYLAPVAAEGPEWATAEVLPESGPDLGTEPAPGAGFAEPPASVLSSREYKRWSASLEDHVYRNAGLDLWSWGGGHQRSGRARPAREARRGDRNAAREVRQETRRARGTTAAGDAEGGEGTRASQQPGAEHRTVGGGRPAGRAVRRRSAPRLDRQGPDGGPQRRPGQQGARRRRPCRSRRPGRAGADRGTERGARGRTRPPRIRVRPGRDPGRDARRRAAPVGSRRPGHGAGLVPLT
jgi:hypothetical protein